MDTPKTQKVKGNSNNTAGRDLIQNFFNTDYIQKKLPTNIAIVVCELEKKINLTVPVTTPLNNLYEIEEKINYNNLIKYKELVKSYGNFGNIIDSVYNTLDNEIPNSKSRFLFYINTQYLLCLGGIIKENPKKERQEAIKENSDKIMDFVFNKLKDNYYSSSNAGDIKMEDVEVCLICIVCKAFIDCKILEIPKP